MALFRTARRAQRVLAQRRAVREHRWKQGLHVSRQALLLYDGKNCWFVPRESIAELAAQGSFAAVHFEGAEGQLYSLNLPFVDKPAGRGRFKATSGSLFRALEQWRETSELIRLDSVREPPGLVAREWLTTVVIGHAALLLVVALIFGAAALVALVNGATAGMVTALLLAAPQFLVFGVVPDSLYGASRRLLGKKPRELRGSGYFVALGFAALWLAIVGSSGAIKWALSLQAETATVSPGRVSDYDGQNVFLEIPGGRGAEGPYFGHAERYGDHGSSQPMNWWVAALEGGPETEDGIPCAWLGVTDAGIETGELDQLNVVGGYFRVAPVSSGYEAAVKLALESRPPCPPIILTPVDSPHAEVRQSLELTFGAMALAHAGPLLALGLWGLGRLDRSWQRPPHDPRADAAWDAIADAHESAKPPAPRTDTRRPTPKGTTFVTTLGVGFVARSPLRFRWKSFLQGGFLLLIVGGGFLLRSLGIMLGPATGPIHAFFMGLFGLICLLMSTALTFQGDVYGAGDFDGWKQRFRFARWRKALAGTTQVDVENPETLAARIQGDLRAEIASLAAQGASDVGAALVLELTGAAVLVSRKVVDILDRCAGSPVPDEA